MTHSCRRHCCLLSSCSCSSCSFSSFCSCSFCSFQFSSRPTPCSSSCCHSPPALPGVPLPSSPPPLPSHPSSEAPPQPQHQLHSQHSAAVLHSSSASLLLHCSAPEPVVSPLVAAEPVLSGRRSAPHWSRPAGGGKQGGDNTQHHPQPCGAVLQLGGRE